MFEESIFSKITRSSAISIARFAEKIMPKASNKITAPIDTFILFDRYLGIGDLLMISPLIRAAAESDKVRECYVVTPWPKIVDVKAEFITRKEFDSTLKRKKPYSVLLISPTVNMRHAVYLLKKQYLFGYFSDNQVYSNFQNVFFSYDSKDGHFSDRIKPLLEWAGVSSLSIDSYPSLLGKKGGGDSFTIAMAPFVRVRGRQWGVANYQKLIEALLNEFKEANIILVGSSNREELDFNSRLCISDRVVDFTGKTTLFEIAGIISGANIFISNDSGLAHMAYLSDCHTFVMFGSVHPETRLPYGGRNNHAIWNDKVCSYFPCHDTMARPRCINKTKYICIDSIEVKSVLNEISKAFPAGEHSCK